MDLNYLGPPSAGATVLLAPGAGGTSDSPWMDQFCELLADRAVRTARFEFGYTIARRSGGRSSQPSAEAVVGEYLEAVAAIREASVRLIIGGKSFGGRVATLVGQKLFDRGTIAGVVCLGYPFHPPGRPDRLRTAHLGETTVPILICQGTRDTFGGAEEVTGYRLSPTISFRWLEDGDHSFRPRIASGRSQSDNLAEAADAVAGFALGA